jgi:hypothetical protein
MCDKEGGRTLSHPITIVASMLSRGGEGRRDGDERGKEFNTRLLINASSSRLDKPSACDTDRLKRQWGLHQLFLTRIHQNCTNVQARDLVTFLFTDESSSFGGAGRLSGREAEALSVEDEPESDMARGRELMVVESFARSTLGSRIDRTISFF